MKKLFTTFLIVAASIALVFPLNDALAYDPYYPTNYPPYQTTEYYQADLSALIQQITQLIVQLQLQLQNQSTYPGNPPIYNGGYTFYPTTGGGTSTSYQRPDVRTSTTRNTTRSSAELQGDLDMRDTRGNEVFFVYGQSRRLVEEIEGRYKEYYDVRRNERVGDYMTVRVDSNPRSREDYNERVTGLDADTRYYFNLCVEFEDNNRNKTLECGDVDDFRTNY